MSPTLRLFMLGFLFGFVVCLGLIQYYGDMSGDWLIQLGRRIQAG